MRASRSVFDVADKAPVDEKVEVLFKEFRVRSAIKGSLPFAGAGSVLAIGVGGGSVAENEVMAAGCVEWYAGGRVCAAKFA